MPDIITIVDMRGHESIPMVGSLVVDPFLGDYVQSGSERFYLRSGQILRQRTIEPAADPVEAPAAPVEEPAPIVETPAEEPAAPAWEIDPADPYAHLSATTRKMLEERDRKARKLEQQRARRQAKKNAGQ